MRKRILVYILALLIIIPAMATLQTINTCLAEEKTGQAEKDYPWLVQGLRKFNYPRDTGYALAVPASWSRYPCKHETKLHFNNKEWQESEKCEVVNIKLVTISGDYLSVKVALDEINMALFLHELSPDFSKYHLWTPVISVSPKYKDNEIYAAHALRLVGRFKTGWDSKKNQIINYVEERYY